MKAQDVAPKQAAESRHSEQRNRGSLGGTLASLHTLSCNRSRLALARTADDRVIQFKVGIG